MWAWRRVRHTWFSYDEWSMIGRVVAYDPLQGATTSFNGHLWLFQDAIYRLQVRVFGLDSNTFVVVVFLISLVCLHAAVSVLAARSGVPFAAAVLLGGLLTYLGPATQNFVFAIQLSPTFATASALVATALVVDRDATVRRASGVAALLLVSVLFDSGVGLLALTLGGGVLVQSWPRRAWWPLAPAASVMAIWYAFADLGPQFPGAVGERLHFAVELVVRSAGAFWGGPAWLGVVTLVAGGVAATQAVRIGALVGPARRLFVAGIAATIVTVAGIAQSRAALPGFTYFENNRYLQNVAIPLTFTFMPVVVVLARRIDIGDRGDRRLSRWLPAVLLLGAFVAGLDEERAYGDVFVDRSAVVHAGVVDGVALIAQGCPTGTHLDPASRPLGDVSPQISTRLLIDLAGRRVFATPDPDEPIDPGIVATMCTAD